MATPFGAWAPDVAGVDNGVLVEARNVLPNVAGYGPVPDLSRYSNALPEKALGAISVKMRLHGVYKLAALTGDSDSNAWTTEAKELIRSSAKRKLAMHDTSDVELANLMAGAEREALDYLKAETSSRTGLGRIRPTEF